MKKFFTLRAQSSLILGASAFALSLLSLTAEAATIFTENMGTSVAGTTSIALSTFQNSGTYTYSGTGDTRTSTASTGYAGVSGGRNVFLTNTSAPRTFQMDGIVTTGYTNLSLSFGAYKDLTTSNMSNLKVEYSTDGSTWNMLTFPAQAAGTGTAIWRLVTITGGTIPAAANLRLRWSNIGTVDQLRIDDITLTGDVAAGPNLSVSALTAFGPQCINAGPYGPNSFTITGSSLSTADVTVGALSGYTYCTTSGGTYTSSLTLTQPGGAYSQAIFVKFDPTAVQNYSGNIPVGGGGASSINVAASGSGVDTAPVVTTGAASALTTSSATVAGTLNTTGICGSVSAYGIEYSTTISFANGSGTPVASTNLSGTAFSSALSGLAPCTVYYTHAYATRASGTTYGTQGTFTTSSIGAPTATAGTSVNSTDFTANWGAVAGATGYQLDVYQGTPSVTEDFTDGNITADPIWVGSTSSYAVLTAATLPSGTGATDGSYLGSNASIGNSVLLMPSSETTEWKFSWGSPTNALSSANYMGVVLMSSASVTSITGSFNGYYLRIGIDGSSDKIELWKSTGATKTKLGDFPSSPTYVNAIPGGLNVRVTRSGSGVFELFYGTGFTYAATPTNSAGTLTDNTYSSSSFFGAYTAFTNTATDRRVYIDNIVLGGSTVYVSGFENFDAGMNTSQLVSGLSPLTTYFYRVRAVGASCTSANSTEISVTTTAGASPSFSAGTLAGFGNVCINSTSAASSFHVDGFNLTNANVTVAALSGFTYSTTSGGTYTTTLSLTQPGGSYSQDIWVKFSPTLVQPYNGNIVVGGGGAPSENVAATGSGIDTAPTLTTGAASAITTSSATVAGQINTVGCGTTTAYGIEYSTTPGFTPGTGTPVASTNISGGNYTSALSGLSPCTPYYYVAYATYASGTAYGSQGTFTSASIAAPVATAGTSIGYNGFTANWAAVGGATGYYIDVSTSPNFGTNVAATGLIISEYVEGSANNKYLELYNGTGASVNLANYTLNIYINGSSFASTSAVLSGTLPNNSTIVYSNSSATIYGGATTNSPVVNFSGDDAVSLTQTVGGAFVDIFGTIGQDPGTNWTAGPLETSEQSLVRKATVTGGISSNPGPGFPGLATEWVGYAQDDVSHLGSHVFNGFIPSFVTGYQDLSVGNVTSYAVTGLDPATMYYFRVRAVSGSCISSNSNTIAVGTLAIPVYYSRASGFTSDDIWSDTPGGIAGPAVFSDSSSVVIQSGDVVTTVGTVDMKDLTVDGGGELVINANHNVRVNGDGDFSGTVTANDNSTLSFLGSGGVVVTGTSALNLFNLTANVPGDLLTDANIWIRGTLSLQDGNFEVDPAGSLTLTSTATRTGRLGPVAGGASYTGNMTVQRYIPAGNTNWRMLGSPVVGRTVNDWQDDFFTAGYPGSAYPNFFSPPGSGIFWPSIRYYNETNPYAAADTGVVGVSSSAQALIAGQGFLTWSGDNFTSTAAFTVDLTGTPNIAASPITLPMSYTTSGTNSEDGWNLVSNPLPSPIDFTLISRGADVGNQYWIFDPATGNNLSWSNGIGQGGLNGHLQSSQGFWIKANGTNLTTTVSESAKIAEPISGGVFGGDQQAVMPILSLSIGSTMNAYSDVATVVFDQGTPALDAIDAVKMTFHTLGAPRMSLRSSDGHDLAIDFFGTYSTAISIPVMVDADETGTYTLTATMAGIQSLSCISIEDLVTGAITPLTDGAAYSFTMNATDDNTVPRLMLHATAPLPFYVENATCANSPNGQATVVVANGPVDVLWTDASGNSLLQQSGVTDGVAIFNGLGAGNYTAHVTPGGACGELVSDFSITVPEAVAANTGSFSSTTCPNSADGVVYVQPQGGTAPYSYIWNTGSTADHVSGVAGPYTVTVTDATGCATNATLMVPAGEGTIAGFTVNEETPIANEEVNFTNTTVLGDAWAWDFGDGSTSTEMEPAHTWALPGTYTVTLIASGGECSDEHTMEVTVAAATGIASASSTGNIVVWDALGHLVIEHPFGTRPVDVSVFDATGRQAIERTGLVNADRITLSDRELGTGVWFVRVKSGSTERTFRVPLVR